MYEFFLKKYFLYLKGDPFSRCGPPSRDTEVQPVKPQNPCIPSPCGSYSECRVSGDLPICSCLNNMIGTPPNCRPECLVNSDCESSKACQNHRCQDICEGSCGRNTICRVHNHIAICECSNGYTGNAFESCVKIFEPRPPEIPDDPCNSCGKNAFCDQGRCFCTPNYKGDPTKECRPECILNTECESSKACISNRCANPCQPGTCGIQATCSVINHLSTCTCPQGMSGDPFVQCRVNDPIPVEPKGNPCSPSPCGKYSQCHANGDRPICSCLANMIGAPPNCRPECLNSNECDLSKSCSNNFRCENPCQQNVCGQNAECRVVSHNPICTCIDGYTGSAFDRCVRIMNDTIVPKNPCEYSNCGPYSECRVIGDFAACTCKQNMIGTPPNCKPECLSNPECPSSLACLKNRCSDPCALNICAARNSKCTVVNHIAICTCVDGFRGDPFQSCEKQPTGKLC